MEWSEKYIECLMTQGGFSRQMAEYCFNAGKDEHDYDEDPEQAALDELSYWYEEG